MSKVTTAQEIKKFMHDGMSIMVGGFGKPGQPDTLIEAVLETGVKDIHVISNSSGVLTKDGVASGVALWVVHDMVKKISCSHIGGCPETGRRMIAGEIEVELIPQGTFIERIRCGGMGLGAVLTPTGVGTPVEEGKEIKEIDGVKYLVEYPLHADVSLICGSIADKAGNVYYKGGTKNFNPAMASAGDLVIAEVDEIVELGEIDPSKVGTPGIMVDYIVKKEAK